MTIYRRFDSNTTPRGFGNAPTYHIDEPYHSDAEMIWVEPVEISLPDGYSIGTAQDGTRYLYDAQGRYEAIVDDHGHPAIVVSISITNGNAFANYRRLDK